MLSPEKIERINELARKKKENGLSKAEERERTNQLAQRVFGSFSFRYASSYRRNESRRS